MLLCHVFWWRKANHHECMCVRVSLIRQQFFYPEILKIFPYFGSLVWISLSNSHIKCFLSSSDAYIWVYFFFTFMIIFFLLDWLVNAQWFIWENISTRLLTFKSSCRLSSSQSSTLYHIACEFPSFTFILCYFTLASFIEEIVLLGRERDEKSFFLAEMLASECVYIYAVF